MSPALQAGSICVSAELPAATADDHAGGHASRRVLDDLEVLPGLRGGLNRVAVCAGAHDADVAGARPGGAVDQRKAGVGKLGNLVAARVSLRIRVARLDLRHEVAGVRLRVRVLSLRA